MVDQFLTFVSYLVAGGFGKFGNVHLRCRFYNAKNSNEKVFIEIQLLVCV